MHQNIIAGEPSKEQALALMKTMLAANDNQIGGPSMAVEDYRQTKEAQHIEDFSDDEEGVACGAENDKAIGMAAKKIRKLHHMSLAASKFQYRQNRPGDLRKVQEIPALSHAASLNSMLFRCQVKDSRGKVVAEIMN